MSAPYRAYDAFCFTIPSRRAKSALRGNSVTGYSFVAGERSRNEYPVPVVRVLDQFLELVFIPLCIPVLGAAGLTYERVKKRRQTRTHPE